MFATAAGVWGEIFALIGAVVKLNVPHRFGRVRNSPFPSPVIIICVRATSSSGKIALYVFFFVCAMIIRKLLYRYAIFYTQVDLKGK